MQTSSSLQYPILIIAHGIVHFSARFSQGAEAKKKEEEKRINHHTTLLLSKHGTEKKINAPHPPCE
jgi:hypothetical protein